LKRLKRFNQISSTTIDNQPLAKTEVRKSEKSEKLETSAKKLTYE